MYKKTIYESPNKVWRIVEMSDDTWSMDDLKGDCYNAQVNNDIDPERLAKEEKEFEQLVYNNGVYGYVLEKWNSQPGQGYQPIDSCFGFVGMYDANSKDFNHYIVEEMKQHINEWPE